MTPAGAPSGADRAAATPRDWREWRVAERVGLEDRCPHPTNPSDTPHPTRGHARPPPGPPPPRPPPETPLPPTSDPARTRPPTRLHPPLHPSHPTASAPLPHPRPRF
ncbi:hypothetical protein GCM10027168_32810 [Streptomyces capparidis]